MGVFANELGRLFESQVFSCPGMEKRHAGSKLGGGVAPGLEPFSDRPMGVSNEDDEAPGAECDGLDSSGASPKCCFELSQFGTYRDVISC